MGQSLSHSGSKKVKTNGTLASKGSQTSTDTTQSNKTCVVAIVAPKTDLLPHRHINYESNSPPLDESNASNRRNWKSHKHRKYLEAQNVTPRLSLRCNRKRTILDLCQHSRNESLDKSISNLDSDSCCLSVENSSMIDWNASLKELLPTKEEHKMLQIIFEDVKQSAEFVAWKGVESLFKKVPSAAGYYNSSPNRPIKNGESWELMGQGIVLLGSLEKAMAQSQKPRRFRKYIAHLAKSHEHYRVPIEDMLMALDIFHSLIASYAFEKTNCNEYTDVCTVLNKFFASMHHELRHHALKQARNNNNSAVNSQPLAVCRTKSWTTVNKLTSGHKQLSCQKSFDV